MVSMFSNCISLKYLRYIYFNTTSLKEMHSMFENCNSILSLDLSYFDTKSITSMSKMFQNCINLVILNLSSFDTSSVIDMSFMFSGCESLEYLDISKFSDENIKNTSNMFNSTRVNLVYTIKKENLFSSIIRDQLSNKECSQKYDKFDWKNEQMKYIINKKKCKKSCKDDDQYKYEYRGFCYEECPFGTRTTFDDEFLCEVICPKEKPYELVSLYNCVKNCSAYNFIMSKCSINYKDDPTIVDNMTYSIDYDILYGEIELLIREEKGEIEDFIIKSDYIYFQITTLNNQKKYMYDSFSKIEFGKSVNQIRQVYNIDEKNNLIIFKTDIIKEGYYIPIIEYSFYDMEKTEKIDFNITSIENIKLNISYPVNINENQLFKYDPFSDYYQKVCYPYTTDNGTDIIMSDRKQEFGDYNYSLCEKNCEYQGYDEETKRAECECKIKNELRIFSKIIIDLDLLYNNFKLSNSYTNIDVFKCYKTFFNYEGIIKNIGSYIIIAIFIIFIVTFILYYLKGYNKLFLKMNQILNVKFYTEDIKEQQKEDIKNVKDNDIDNASRNNKFNPNSSKVISSDRSMFGLNDPKKKEGNKVINL